ncbi:hypothetical protein WJ69_34305 [Burkholderia ubonensis]|nr:hypothetical protein WJ69_34305 [Burkholderia ubonensis]
MPLSHEQRLYDLTPTKHPRLDLMTPEMRRHEKKSADEALKRLADCQDVSRLVGYGSAALADYIANLSDPECAYELFLTEPALAVQIDRPENVAAVADRFAAEANTYRSANGVLLNLTLYLRAAYYLSMGETIPPISPDIQARLRPALMQLVTGPVLFTPNQAASTTAGEVLTLITNLHDEANYLDAAKQRVAGFTNSPSTPDVAKRLDDPNVGYGFTGLLKIVYYSHYRPDAVARMENDPSYASTLYAFVRANKPALLNDPNSSYQLNQAASEAFRFAMHPALLATVSGFIKDALAHSTMAEQDRLIWLAAAQSVKAYDNANCQSYGTCNFEGPLAAAILSSNHHCANGVVRLRTQELTSAQAGAACNLLDRETLFFMRCCIRTTLR